MFFRFQPTEDSTPVLSTFVSPSVLPFVKKTWHDMTKVLIWETLIRVMSTLIWNKNFVFEPSPEKILSRSVSCNRQRLPILGSPGQWRHPRLAYSGMGIYYKSKTGSIQFLEYAILLLVHPSHPWVTKEPNFEPFPSVHIISIPSIKKTLPEAQRTQGFARPRLILPKNPDLAQKSTEAVSKESLALTP